MASINKVKVKTDIYDISPSPNGTLDTTTANNKFESSDVAQGSATSWTNVDPLAATETNKSIFTKITQMIKNVRFLYNIIGIGFSTSNTIKNQIDSKAPSNHTHNYAGSGSIGGSANSAVKLDTATAGSTTQPVYFSGGKPVAIGYTIAKSVPADAKFTDTNTWRGIQNNLTSTATDQSLSAAQGKLLNENKATQNNWDCSIKCATWSRLCYIAAYNIVIGSSFILNIAATRANVVYNETFAINVNHSQKSTIVKIATAKYSMIQIRVTSDPNGNCYVEIYDNANGATNTTTQIVTCRLIGIRVGTVTTYTAFTNGATLASGYVVSSSITINSNSIQGNLSWGEITDKPSSFTAASHNHDDRYYTESEMNSKLNGKVDNTEAGCNALMSKAPIWTAVATDDTYFIRQDTAGGASFGRVKFSTLWSYIKGKSDSTYQAKGSYAAANHTHNYAGSGSAGGSANSAVKLDTSTAGSTTQPVYFSGGKPVAIGYTIASSVPANAKFTDTTYGVATASSNGLMSSTDKTKLDDFSRVISIQKQIKLTTDWQDTGIAGNNLETGTYIIQVSGFNSSYTSLYNEIYSGIMTWYASETNSDNSSEIFLHNAGHADNSNAIYLRTSRRSYGNGGLHLQIACKVAASGTDTLTFKFRRLI